MDPRQSGRRPFSPISHEALRGLPLLVMGLFALVGLAVLALSRPSLGSAHWLAALSAAVLSPFPVVWDWCRLRRGAVWPVTLAVDALAAALLWSDPHHPAAGAVLIVLVSVFIGALFPIEAALVHLGLAAAALFGAAWLGGDLGMTAVILMVVIVLTAFMRGLYETLRELAVQTDHLKRLMELLPVLKAQGVEEVVRAAVRHMVRATSSRMGIVFLLDEAAQVLRPQYIHSEEPLPPEQERTLLSVEVPMGVGLSGWAAMTGQSVITGDAARDPRGFQVPGTEVEDESIMVVPLMTNGRLYGVLRLDRPGLHQYRDEDLRLLELMAAHVSDALSRAQIEERMARRDALTGVYNRHFLNEWSERLTPDPCQISLLMIDCRGFKAINDRWGHLVGDTVLQEAARLISQCVRCRDLVFRYGGDEFLVVLENTGAEEASAIAGRIHRAVGEWNRRQPEGAPRLCLDIGIETAERADWRWLLSQADRHMYAAKRRA